MKRAKKAKDPAAAKAAADERARAAEVRVQADAKRAEAQSQRDLAEAEHDLAEAEHDLAVAKLERVKAQAVSDAGGWVDMPRFDTALDEATAKVKEAEKELERAKSRAVITAQGG